MSDTSQGEGWWIASDGKWYPPQPAGSGKPKKKFYTRVWFWLLVIVVLFLGGCITVITSVGVAVDKAVTANQTVVYTVTGDGTANITYDTWTNNNSGTSQVSDAAMPWTKTITATGTFSTFSVMAQLQTGTTSTCTITVNGKQVSSNTSTGQYSIATCSATGSG